MCHFGTVRVGQDARKPAGSAGLQGQLFRLTFRRRQGSPAGFGQFAAINSRPYCLEDPQELQSPRHRLRPLNPAGPANKIKEAMKRSELVKRYRIAENKGFRLTDVKPADTWKLKSKDHAQEWLEKGVARLSELQEKLYAQNQWAVLLIFQAMDAAGKDGTIKHVMSGINPQGCEVASFKVPSEEELNHDFLWRTTKRLPERGRIGIFNRSYYEETLVLRVHPELLATEKLPAFPDHQGYLAGAVRGHQCLRTPSHAQRSARAEVLPPHLQTGTAGKVPQPPGVAGEELEVLPG